MVKDLGQSLPKLPAGLPKDGQHETANLVHSAAVRLLRTARAADTDLDLDGPRASLLSVLVFAGPQPVTKLAALEQVSAPAITKMVSTLESAGLAQRKRSEADRRIVLVSATPAGKRLLERGRAARVRAIATLLADATDEQLQTLRAASDVIAARLTPGPGRD
jgi:DNA-binding MarR family transcriptional regulator